MTYERLNGMLQGRCKESKKLCNNTYAVRRDEGIAVRLHATDVLLFYPDGRVRFSTGGWETVATKDRINSYSPGGFRVGSDRGLLYLYPNCWDRSSRVAFFDGITTTRKGTIRKEDQRHGARIERNKRADQRKEKREKDQYRRECKRAGLIAHALSQCFAAEREAARVIGDTLSELFRVLSVPYTVVASWLHDMGESQKVAREVNVYPPDDAVWGWHYVYKRGEEASTMNGHVPVRKGQTLHVPAGAEMCHYGLHASYTPTQARGYCPGTIACRVLLWGQMDGKDDSGDKFCAEYRHVVYMVDVKDLRHIPGGPDYSNAVWAKAGHESARLGEK